jgi:diaminopimelate epimerase
VILPFYKYQGTGNDFILIDNRNQVFPFDNVKLINRLCHRRLGIGADGLMLLEHAAGYDFRMVYFNSDGRESTMCGNGGRCIAAFAYDIGLIRNKAEFIAIDGPHSVEIESEASIKQVSLKMNDVAEIHINNNDFILNTGSPHYIVFSENAESLDVFEEGKKIRYSETFRNEGINVNFVEVKDNQLIVRTYERGVEDETWSCGTGVTAAAIAAIYSGKINSQGEVAVQVKGGSLKVKVEHNEKENFTDVWLKGPADFVFKGEIEI